MGVGSVFLRRIFMGPNHVVCGTEVCAFLSHSDPAGCAKHFCTGPECLQKLRNRRMVEPEGAAAVLKEVKE